MEQGYGPQTPSQLQRVCASPAVLLCSHLVLLTSLTAMAQINVASVLSVMLDSAVRRHGPEHGQRLNESERDLADMLEGKCTAAPSLPYVFLRQPSSINVCRVLQRAM